MRWIQASVGGTSYRYQTDGVSVWGLNGRLIAQSGGYSSLSRLQREVRLHLRYIHRDKLGRIAWKADSLPWER